MPRVAFALLFLPAAALLADDPFKEFPRTKPLEPAESAKQFEARPGFHVELVASEPLLRSPVAIDFDEHGRMYVAEFVEYNQYANPNPPPDKGAIKLLTDTDGDGRFDKSVTFADNLDQPVAVACWDGGVFVGIVPDLWYMKDTDGDGKADVKRKVLTGFDRDKAGEAMLNSFRWGPDNRFHIATGLAGGNLKPADKPDAKPTLVRRQNIRFDPRTNAFEPTSGGGQHGMSLDDWGDTFVCDNSNPIEHLAYDAKYANRNPFVIAPSAIVDINAAGRYPNLKRISPPEPWREARTRLRKDKLVPGSDEGGQPFGFFTGSTGVTVYRGDAFPREFHGNVFVGEIANNLVYRAKLEPKGLGWTAIRAEKDREFVASKDVQFRPVQFANAPDGTLYIVDMYRELIEGAAFLPPQVLKYVDVAGGMNRGRIWRVAPDGFKPKPLPKFSEMRTRDLVKLLEHPTGWHRDTAARLLYQRQDESAMEELWLLANSEVPEARMHALYAIQGLGRLRSPDVIAALKDTEPRVREHALRLSEGFGLSAGLAKRFDELVDDPNPRVRYQLAFTLGSFKGETIEKHLAHLAHTDGGDPGVRFALLCSMNDRGAKVFAELLADEKYRSSETGKAFLLALASQIAAANRTEETSIVLKSLGSLADKSLARTLVQAFASGLPPAVRGKFASTGDAAKLLAELVADARKVAADEKASDANRAAAIRTLGLAPFADVKELLRASLGVRQPVPVQVAALQTLATFDSSEVPAVVIAAWPGMSPQIRTTAVETLLTRSTGVIAFLDAVEKGTIRPTDLDPARVKLLQQSPDEKIRTRAAKLFQGTTNAKRAEVIAKYQKALELKGDAAKGKLLFKESCSSCHKLEGVGEAVGPDLAAIKQRGIESVLTNILDPNREVLPQYYTYLLTTDDDVTITGMIAAETANTVTIRKADGTSSTIQRVNIATLKSSGLSAMPEGLEDKLSVEAMADLLAYLASLK
ncbi:MAG: PVC-type heme-binding CxxCH protein [Gemmataceae bacterium]